MHQGRAFARTAVRFPERTAVVEPAAGVEYTYGELAERARSVGASLAEHGVGSDTRVATVSRNRAELVTLYVATQLLDATFVPLNFRSSRRELTELFENAAVDVVAHSADTAADVAGAAERYGDVDALVDIDGGSDALAFSSLVADGPDELRTDWSDPDATSLILYTAGTTGRPKGVPRTHRNTYAAAAAHAVQCSWRQGETTVDSLPLSHTMGIHALAATVLLNGTVVVQRSAGAADIVAALRSERVTALYLVPTMYRDLVEHDDLDEADAESVEHVAFAGASMRATDVRAVRETFDPEALVNHYGSTEVYTHTTCSWVSEAPGSAGRAGINTAIRVVRPSALDGPDPDATVDPGEVGEVAVDATSPEAFDGYLTPERDEGRLAEGWFFTGDLGYLDSDGDLWVVDRADNMILSGGENIYPVEVEHVLGDHPYVTEVAVVGRSDERWTRKVTAFVVLSDDPEVELQNYEAIADELDRHCVESDRIADYKRPREYYFVDRLSKSNVGKILRKELERDPLDVPVYATVDVVPA